MPLPISPTIDALNCLLSVYLGVRLWRAAKLNPESQSLRWFAYTYGFLTLAYAALALPRFFDKQNEGLLIASFTFGNACFLVAAAFFSQVIFSFTLTRYRKPVFIVAMVLVGIAVLAAILQPGLPLHDVQTGITRWNAPPVAGAISGAFLIVVLLASGALFFRRAVQANSYVVRVRSLTIGFGSILLLATAVIFYAATTEVLAVTGDGMSIAALLTVFFGAVYHRPTGVSKAPKLVA